jgi:hypothetical protein
VQGLRPGIRARVKPFTRAFKKAHEVEVKPKRGRGAQQPAATAKKKHGNNGGNNGGNSGGNDGGKDKRKRPYHDTPSQSYTPSTPSRNHSHSNLPSAPWVDRETRDKREEKTYLIAVEETTKRSIARSIRG